MEEMNIKSGSYFNQMLTVLLTMKIYSEFNYTEYIPSLAISFDSTF